MEWINIILLVIAIIVHELGHYVAYKIIGKKPDIKFKWYGILIGENIWHTLKPFEAYIVSIVGIITGFFIVMNNYELTLIYLLMCCIDIVNIILIMGIKKEYKKLSLLEINKLQLQELEASVSGVTQADPKKDLSFNKGYEVNQK
jgi:hypothetical protein